LFFHNLLFFRNAKLSKTIDAFGKAFIFPDINSNFHYQNFINLLTNSIIESHTVLRTLYKNKLDKIKDK